jgi:hypothetical protein
MTPKPLHSRSRKGRANARPFRNIETMDIETIEITDEVAQSLIDSFPASDPPAWIPLARVGIPKRQKTSRPAPKERQR